MTLMIPVKHFRQTSDWDCGITCLRMLINFYKLNLSSFDSLINQYDCNKSTWTIDLLHLLHQSGIKAILHTITIGCSSTYENVRYYEKTLANDRERVHKLFTNESSNVKLGSVQWSDIKAHLIEHETPCIVLVDANQIKCFKCSQTLLNKIFGSIVSRVSSSYQGHYIVVIGFDIKENEELVYYLDPDRSDEYCTTTTDNFNQARTAFGTDEDIIFCYK